MTVAAMIIVISLWLVYINYSIKGVDNKIEAVKMEKSEIDFLEVFKKGLSVAGSLAKEKIKNFGYKIMGGEIIILENN